MDTVTIDASGNWQWLVSNSVIQSWIDNPGDNNGMAVRPLGIYANDCWRSRQRAVATQRPKLIFTLQNLNKPPRMPTNQTPVDATIGLARPVTLTASAFSDPDGDGHQASQWQGKFSDERPLSISVNLSSRQFSQSDLVDQIKHVL